MKMETGDREHSKATQTQQINPRSIRVKSHMRDHMSDETAEKEKA